MFNEITLLLLLIGAVIGGLIGYSRWSLRGESNLRMPERTFPNEWRRILQEKVEFYNRLPSSNKTDFEKRVHVFLLNVQVTGVDTEITHTDRILVAAGAIIPIWHYSNLKEVQIHPNKFVIPTTDTMASGLVGWGAMEGKMMLLRKAIEHGFYDQSDNKNVVIHEFIHVLDKQDGEMDGVIEQVMNEIDIMPWLQIINMKMQEIGKGQSTIRDYGVTNKAEFLAVVSEFFFENPERMKTEHPALYNALNSFFNPRDRKMKIQNRFKSRRRKK